MTFKPIGPSLAINGAVALTAMIVLALLPPSTGAMLLVPLTTRNANFVAKVAWAGGADLLGSGPLQGSLIVFGNRSRIARQIPSWSIIILAAPTSGCGPDGYLKATA